MSNEITLVAAKARRVTGGKELIVARRRYQSGCLYKRGKRNKVWVARWRDVVITEDGTLRRILRAQVLGSVAEIPTKTNARRLLEQRLQTINAGVIHAESAMRFGDFVERRWKPAFLATYKRSTQEQCRFALKNYLLPAFGNRPLREISKADIQVFITGLLQRLAPDSVHGIHRYLRRMLGSAVEWGYVQANPARGVKLARRRRREPPFITPAQFEQLVLELPEPVSTMILVAMLTSMRIGEILGLRWRRVDLENGTLRVAETCYRGQFASTKTQRSERQVPLVDAVLRRLRVRSAALWPAPHDLVFASSKGTPLRDGNLLRRFIYPACDRLGIPRLAWHALRHLHGSLLSQLGVPVAVAQAQLGHADPRITLEIYTHVLPGAQRDAVERLERYLFPNVPKLPQLLGNAEFEGAGLS